MREIKFRGKRISDGVWVYGDLSQGFDEQKGRHSVDIVSQHFEAADLSYPYPSVATNWNEVDPETVGQSTGLEDYSGNEIYEGDILKCYNKDAKDTSWGLEKDHIGVVEYTAPLFSLKIPGKLIYDGGAVKQWENDVYLNEWDNAEVIEKIGNIFDNPELLK